MAREYYKLKFAIHFGYNGRAFHGLQKAQGVITIDEVLEKALFDAKLISSSNFGNLKKIGWGRGSRTDKGVHASINTIKCNLDINKKYLKNENNSNEDKNSENENNNGEMNKKKFRTLIDLEKIVMDINSVMREDVRVFGLKYITKSFVVKNSATSRNYEYILPLSILKVGKFESFSNEKFMEDLNLFLQVFKGTHNYHNYTKKGNFKLASSKRHILKIQAEIFDYKFDIDIKPKKMEEDNKNEVKTENKVEIEKLEEKIKKNEKNSKTEENGVNCENKLEIEKSEEKSSKREYVRIFISGQSFIYNQIRKMVGSVIFVYQNNLDQDFINNSFAENFTNIWLAPSEGLLLERILFENYNKKDDIPMKLNLSKEENELANNFKENSIYKSIIEENESKNVFGLWLEEKKYY